MRQSGHAFDTLLSLPWALIYDEAEDSSSSTGRYIIVVNLTKPLNVDGCEVVEQSTNVACQMLKETSILALKPVAWRRPSQSWPTCCPQVLRWSRQLPHFPVMCAILRPRVRRKLKDTLLLSVIQLHLELERCKFRAWSFTCILFFEISYGRSPGTKLVLYADGKLLSFHILRLFGGIPRVTALVIRTV